MAATWGDAHLFDGTVSPTSSRESLTFCFLAAFKKRTRLASTVLLSLYDPEDPGNELSQALKTPTRTNARRYSLGLNCVEPSSENF